MHEANDMRRLYREGVSIAEIARRTGRSEPTVRKYVRADDLSPKPPKPKGAPDSKVARYDSVIRSWLEEDTRGWHKQRHTSARIHERLRDEYGCDASYWTVRRYVERLRSEAGADRWEQYLDLVWEPGTAQVDFGEADFYVLGARVRMKFLVVVFPYSNVGFAQVFGGENAECVCEGLKAVFEHVGGVPARVVFDNATGVGRKVCGAVRTTETFAGFAAQYGFDFAFCNPESGNEKGCVERKVSYLRQHLFVPVPRMDDPAAYNRRLLAKCEGLSEGKEHYLKGAPEGELFLDDSLALRGLPEKPYDVVRYEVRRTDKKGKFTLGGKHRYSTDPSLALSEVTVGLRAWTVEVYDRGGAKVCVHARAYGDAPTDTCDPARQLALLCRKPGAWQNSEVRASLPDRLRAYADDIAAGGDVRPFLRLLRDEAAGVGYAVALEAMARTCYYQLR